MPYRIRKSDKKEYTFYFTDGSKDILRGVNRSEAFLSAYPYRDLSKLSFYVAGRDNSFIFNNGQWVRTDMAK